MPNLNIYILIYCHKRKNHNFHLSKHYLSILFQFYYFLYDLNKHCLLISDDNFEAEANGGYQIEFYEIPEIRFTELEDLKELVKLLKKGSI